MKSIARKNLEPIEQEELESLVNTFLSVIVEQTSPLKVYLFGSAVTGCFDSASDLDFLVVYEDKDKAKLASKQLYRTRPIPSQPTDYICVDRKSFDNKSTIGGVCYVAANEGKLLFCADTQTII